MLLTTFILLFCLHLSVPFRPTTLQCPPCDVTKCPTLGTCVQGITWDVCDCCETCAKTLGEECGGPWHAYGKCDSGLRCFKDVRSCPYLFSTRRSFQTPQNNKMCEEFLANAIGRCIQDTNLVTRNFKRFGFRGKSFGGVEDLKDLHEDLPKDLNDTNLLQEIEVNPSRNEITDKRRVLLSGVLKGYEY
ncbi:UNVERIFIED_CONTAM: hypothetical protein RMT77_006453 [Armadillidium vulgare]